MKELDSTARKLLGYARQEWGMLALSFVIFALAGAVEPAIPALFKKLIDTGFQGGLDYPIWLVPLIIIGLFLLRGLLNYCGTYVVQTTLGRIVLESRLQLMSALSKAPSNIFTSPRLSHEVNKIFNDLFWASHHKHGH